MVSEKVRDHLGNAEAALSPVLDDPQFRAAGRLISALWEAVAQLHYQRSDPRLLRVEQQLTACATSLLSTVSAHRDRPVTDRYPKDKSAAAEALRDRLVEILDENPRPPVEEIAIGLEIARFAHRATEALPSRPPDQSERVALWAKQIDRILRDSDPVGRRHDRELPASHRRSTKGCAERIVRACARASGLKRSDNLFVAEHKRTGAKRGPKPRRTQRRQIGARDGR